MDIVYGYVIGMVLVLYNAIMQWYKWNGNDMIYELCFMIYDLWYMIWYKCHEIWYDVKYDMMWYMIWYKCHVMQCHVNYDVSIQNFDQAL